MTNRTHHSWLVPLVCLAFIGLVACTSQEAAGPSETVGPELSFLSVSLDVPSEVRRGEKVTLTLKVRNVSDDPVTVGLVNSPPYDFVIARPSGAEVWRWLSGRVVQSWIDLKELAPGEELRFEAEWDQKSDQGEPVAVGTYEVRGTLSAGPGPNRLETEPASIVISP